jgi:hypothetical protein
MNSSWDEGTVVWIKGIFGKWGVKLAVLLNRGYEQRRVQIGVWNHGRRLRRNVLASAVCGLTVYLHKSNPKLQKINDNHKIDVFFTLTVIQPLLNALNWNLIPACVSHGFILEFHLRHGWLVKSTWNKRCMYIVSENRYSSSNKFGASLYPVYRSHSCYVPNSSHPTTVTNSVAPEPEGSSPRTQQPASDPYPEPGESTPQPPNQSP